ncbi:MAG TPA: energy transducer TonB, partial [Woeseiaceae bacterium]
GALIAWWLSQPEMPVTEPADVAESEIASPQTVPSFVETDVPRRESQTLPDAAPLDLTSVAPPYQALLEEARKAREAGDIVAPAGSNAIELYVAALQLAPGETLLVSELGATVNDALALVEQALLEQRGADADAALRMVRLADPQNARLAFLSAQATQLEVRTRLDEARTAMRDNRFEVAARAIAGARSAGADAAEVNALSEELARVRSAQRVEDVLSLAGQRLAEDALISPANDNARYYFDLALSNDAGNTAAQQGLAIVASKLVLRAREAIDGGRLDEAERLLQDAGNIDSGSSELAASALALTNARAAQEQAAREALAAEQAAQAAAVSDEATEEAPFETAALTDADIAATEDPDSDATLREPSFAQPATAMRRSSQPPAGSAVAEADSSEFVAISALQRTNYVAPRYPRVAQRRGITGWVDVGFTVTSDGGVTDIEIMNAEPAELFNDSASDAVAEWRFEPPMRDGRPVSQRVAVRMMFSLQ